DEPASVESAEQDVSRGGASVWGSRGERHRIRKLDPRRLGVAQPPGELNDRVGMHLRLDELPLAGEDVLWKLLAHRASSFGTTRPTSFAEPGSMSAQRSAGTSTVASAHVGNVSRT